MNTLPFLKSKPKFKIGDNVTYSWTCWDNEAYGKKFSDKGIIHGLCYAKFKK